MKRMGIALLAGLLLISCSTETAPEETPAETAGITVSEEPEWLTPPEEPVTSLITKEEGIPEGEMWIPVYCAEGPQTNEYAFSEETIVPGAGETSAIYCYYPCVTINPVLADSCMDVLLIEDGSLRLFDLRTGEITELSFSGDDFTALSLSGDAETEEITEIVCSNDDGSVQIFDLKSKSFLDSEEKSPR